MLVLVLNGKLYRKAESDYQITAFGLGWVKLGRDHQDLLDRWDKMHKLAQIKNVFLRNGLYKVEDLSFHFLLEAS